MALFKKKPDPISARGRQLRSEIVELENQIQQLNQTIAQTRRQPRVRSTALPSTPGGAPAPAPRDPVFEKIEGRNASQDLNGAAAQYNDLGVRKYDLAGLWKKFLSHLRGPASNNPKLVSYLAAGSIKGLRPLRYEKRVARNRFLALFILFILFLLGLISIFFRNHP